MAFEYKHPKQPKTLFGYVEWLYFIYCLTTGIYMLDAWERYVFNSCLILVLSMSFYTAYAFLPQHIFAHALTLRVIGHLKFYFFTSCKISQYIVRCQDFFNMLDCVMSKLYRFFVMLLLLLVTCFLILMHISITNKFYTRYSHSFSG
uniref:Uncharacterized protein n=1 Tax=Ciona savignyi TaxID=51511 RepID=H2Z1J7_CIOSA